VIGARSAALLLAAAAIVAPSAAYAQASDPPAFRVEAAVGVSWIGRQPLGSGSANETTGTGGTSALFSASSELGSAAGVDGRIGVRLGRSLVAEAEASYATPPLRIALSADAEGAAAVTAAETIQQFTVGAGVRWSLPGRRWSPRFAPFVSAGGGYLRQLHDQATLVETGRYYQAGGGATCLLVTTPHFHTKGIGARVDARAVVRAKGVAFDGGSKTSPAVGVSAFVRF
jgi:hypothetical protein